MVRERHQGEGRRTILEGDLDTKREVRRGGTEMAAAYSGHATRGSSVLLGYPDEEVSAAVDFTTNMIGGMPVSNYCLFL